MRRCFLARGFLIPAAIAFLLPLGLVAMALVRGRQAGTAPGPGLRLIPQAPNVSVMPATGQDLIVVADVGGKLNFRIFDAAGRKAADTDETTLSGKELIADLRKRLLGLWPPHPLTRDEKNQVIALVKSIAESGSAVTGNDIPPLIFPGAPLLPETPHEHDAGTPEAVAALRKVLAATRQTLYADFAGELMSGGKPIHVEGSYKEEAFLELMYLRELNRELQNSTSGPSEAAGERIQNLERTLGFLKETAGDVTPLKFESTSPPRIHPYPGSYTQWYALVCYLLRGVDGDWLEGGSVELLLDDLCVRTAKWRGSLHGGDGRDRIDGSIACAALYATLHVYLNTDLIRERVGLRLGTPAGMNPEVNQQTGVKYDDRRLVKLLTNICAKIEQFNPELNVGPKDAPATARTKYTPSQTYGERTLAGGRVLYFLAKAALAYEAILKPDDRPAQEVIMRDYLDRARKTIAETRNELAAFSAADVADTRAFNTYALTYLMRGITIYMRVYANSKDSDKCNEMLVWAQAILAGAKKRGCPVGYSAYYGPLSTLQYITELGHALKNLGEKSSGGER